MTVALNAVSKIGKPEIVGAVFKHKPAGWLYKKSDKPSSKKLLLALEPDFKGDPWGCAMSAAFDIAPEMYERGLPNILDYTPGAGGNELSDDADNRALLESLTDSAIVRLAEYVNRVLEALERAGKDY